MKLPNIFTFLLFISFAGPLFSGGILERYRGSVQEKSSISKSRIIEHMQKRMP